MTTAGPANGVVYDLEGTLLEACSCGVLCPCWVGADPDGGACDAFNAYRFERGTIRGIDVSGLSFINVCHIPGNVLTPGSWQVVSFVDDRASDEQFQAILDAYHGRLGGPLADLAGLVGEVVAVERAPIVHETRDGTGTLRIGEVVSAEMAPFRSADGATVTTLRDSLFSTVPGSPAYVARAHHHTVNLPEARDGLVVRGPQRHPVRLPHRLHGHVMTAAATLGRRRLPAAVPAAIALAWAAAVAAHATGLADRFHHHALLAHGALGLAGVGGYALLWCVMVGAMMLPSAVPLLRLFAEVSAARRGAAGCWPASPAGTWPCGRCSGGRRWRSTTSSTAWPTPSHGWAPIRGWWPRPPSGWPAPSSSRPSRTAA